MMGCILIHLHEPDVPSYDEVYERCFAECMRSLEVSRLQKRGRIDEHGNLIPKRRRKVVAWNWERARASICEDWTSPMPKFDDRMFVRHFRITRAIMEEIYTIVTLADPFFRENECTFKRTRTIYPYAKILMPLKMMGYGTSPSAHQDYFQMGETTAMYALKRLCKILGESVDLRERLVHGMTRRDAQKVSELHQKHHGVEGMVGSLDCMHVTWKNCPVAWQGSHAGKSGHPTIVLEAMADYNLYFWHASFGCPREFNIWEGSDLIGNFLDGSWMTDVDFVFQVNGQLFSKLYFLVDGIYPEISRFVKTIPEPVGQQQNYNWWHESSRKDIERAFCVLQSKFKILVRKVQLHYEEDIKDIAFCCILLHNWMVQHRLSVNEEESADWYDCESDGDQRDDLDRAITTTQEHDAVTQAFYPGFDAIQQERLSEQMEYCNQLVQKQWGKLPVHEKDKNRRLHVALIAQIMANKAERNDLE